MHSEAQSEAVQAALYVVATPIGNLEDLSDRARQVLSSVDLIAAEDTRHSGRLLQHSGIRTRLYSYHDHSQQDREERLLSILSEGRSVALISDAGTPLISDPGYSLVRKARQQGIPVRPIPGPCALTAALSVAGLASDRFVFEGFPPAKSQARRKHFESLQQESRTLIFYESPHRIESSLQDMQEMFGAGREAVICRELTKLWETVESGSLQSLCTWLAQDDNNRRGEFVVLVSGAPATEQSALEAQAIRTLDVLLEELPVKKAAALAARLTGWRKNALYQLALERQDARNDQGSSE